MLIRLKEKKCLCRERILIRDSIERGKNKILNLNDFNNGWNIYKNKEKKYRSIINRGITLNKDSDLDTLLKNLTK